MKKFLCRGIYFLALLAIYPAFLQAEDISSYENSDEESALPVEEDSVSEPMASQTSIEDVSKKEAAEKSEMKKRWNDIFSKDIVQGSKQYEVKSGDSLYVIAKKNHTTVDLIKKQNDLKSDTLRVGKKLKVQTEPFSIDVSKSKNVLTLFGGNHAVKKYSVATGKESNTPVGTFKIKDKLENPTWYKKGEVIPPGVPENGLGTRWLGFDKPSYGIHGTNAPETIGTQASEGCIRMLNADVEELFSLVPAGTEVRVQD